MVLLSFAILALFIQQREHKFPANSFFKSFANGAGEYSRKKNMQTGSQTGSG